MEFVWAGDLDDDCTCRVGPYTLRAEAMGEVGMTVFDVAAVKTPADDPANFSVMQDYWWACVYCRGEEVWSTNERGGWVIGGDMARQLAEFACMADMLKRAMGHAKATQGCRKRPFDVGDEVYVKPAKQTGTVLIADKVHGWYLLDSHPGAIGGAGMVIWFMRDEAGKPKGYVGDWVEWADLEHLEGE